MQAGRLDCMIIDEVYGGYKNAKLGSIFAVSEVDFGDDCMRSDSVRVTLN